MNLEALLEGWDIATRILEDPLDGGVEQERVEEMLDGHVFVATTHRLAGCERNGDFDFRTYTHQVGSVVSRRGIPLS